MSTDVASGGSTFTELPALPRTGFITETAGDSYGADACGVFLDDTTFMVIGGMMADDELVLNGGSTKYFVSDEVNLLDVTTETWISMPPLSQARGRHTCRVVTDCDGNKQVK